MKTILQILFIGGLIITASSSAQAKLVDGWKIKQVALATTVRLLDGSEIRLNGEGQVGVVMRLETLTQYGSSQTRDVTKSQVTAGSGTANGVVELEVETEIEFACTDRAGGFAPAMMAPHSAGTTFRASAGNYDLVINGLKRGTLVVARESVTFEDNPTYEADVDALGARVFAHIFKIGPAQPLSISTNRCSVTVADVPEGFQAAYQFAGSSESLADGATVTRPPVQGTALLTSIRTQIQCAGQEFDEMTVTLRGDRGQLVLSVDAALQVRAEFRTSSGKGCSN